MKIMYFVLYLVSAALLIFYLKSSFSFSFYLSGIALLISEKLYESCLVLNSSFVSSVCDEINQEMPNYCKKFISLLNNFRDSY